MNTSLIAGKSYLSSLSLLTWATVLLVSDLPNAIWQATLGEPPPWLFWAKISLLAVLLLISLTSKPIQNVRPYFFLLLILMLGLWGLSWLRGTAAYKQWEQQVSWVIAMAGFQLMKLAIALAMIFALSLMGRKRTDFFLTSGQLRANIKPANVKEPTVRRFLSWGGLGLILGVCIAPLTLLFIGFGNLPGVDTIIRVLPYLPAALLFAAANAFSEEMQFRASLLGDLKNALGPDQAIWLTATFFGFAHYFSGPPAGIPGVLITGLLGALFAKCMLGSKGIVVPWFIHFCQNAVIYAFMAIGAVA